MLVFVYSIASVKWRIVSVGYPARIVDGDRHVQCKQQECSQRAHACIIHQRHRRRRRRRRPKRNMADKNISLSNARQPHTHTSTAHACAHGRVGVYVHVMSLTSCFGRFGRGGSTTGTGDDDADRATEYEWTMCGTVEGVRTMLFGKAESLDEMLKKQARGVQRDKRQLAMQLADLQRQRAVHTAAVAKHTNAGDHAAAITSAKAAGKCKRREDALMLDMGKLDDSVAQLTRMKTDSLLRGNAMNTTKFLIAANRSQGSPQSVQRMVMVRGRERLIAQTTREMINDMHKEELSEDEKEAAAEVQSAAEADCDDEYEQTALDQEEADEDGGGVEPAGRDEDARKIALGASSTAGAHNNSSNNKNGKGNNTGGGGGGGGGGNEGGVAQATVKKKTTTPTPHKKKSLTGDRFADELLAKARDKLEMNVSEQMAHSLAKMPRSVPALPGKPRGIQQQQRKRAEKDKDNDADDDEECDESAEATDRLLQKCAEQLQQRT
jgi:hypothetical protein